MIETADDLADPNNAAAAYMKLQDDVKKLIQDTVMEMLKAYNYDLTAALQTHTLGTPEFERRVKQVITNQMQR